MCPVLTAIRAIGGKKENPALGASLNAETITSADDAGVNRSISHSAELTWSGDFARRVRGVGAGCEREGGWVVAHSRANALALLTS